MNSVLVFGMTIHGYQIDDAVAGGGGLLLSGNELSALQIILLLVTLGILIDLKKSFILVYSVIALYGFAMFSGGMKLAIGSYIYSNVNLPYDNFASMARSPRKFLGLLSSDSVFGYFTLQR